MWTSTRCSSPNQSGPQTSWISWARLKAMVGRRANTMSRSRSVGVKATSVPVSYTHLDVYKRQALPIPENIKTLYVAAAARYKLPWTLVAGIGMEATGHGRTEAVSSSGAQGLMQFMPATWATYGVDGDGDGRAIITNDADSIYTAANLSLIHI